MSEIDEVEITVLEKNEVVTKLKTSSFPIVFGRSPDCALRLNQYDFLSRTHGTITNNDGRIRVSDLNSKNGIIYQGSKNTDFYLNDNSDKFDVADLTFSIKIVSFKKPPSPSENVKKVNLDDSIVIIKTNQPENQPLLEPKDQVTEVDKPIHEPSTLGFSILPIPGLEGIHQSHLCLQSVITWGDDIFDVRNFYSGDQILLSDREDGPIYIPFLNKTMKSMGVYKKDGAYIELPLDVTWSVFNGTIIQDESSLLSQRRLKRTNQKIIIKLNASEVLSTSLSLGICLHFRFVPIPTPFIQRTWIENREEFKKAAWTSGLIHFILSAFALLSAPKVNAPKIPNMPPRIAKLIVEPPPSIITPPPPPPPPPVIEEPPPQIKEVEPPPKIEKVIKKPEIVVPKRMAEKVKQEKVDKVVEREVKKQIETPSETKEVALENLFKSNTISKNPGLKLNSKNFNLAMNTNSNNLSNQGLKGLSNALKNQNPSGASGPLVGDGGGANIGKINFAQNLQGSKTGKRNIEGAVVGAPKIAGKLDDSQGLTNEQVMNVVNKFHGDIQRCYERALFSDPNLSGRVEYEWNIESSGSVSSVRIKRSNVVKGDALNECVIGIFRKMKFPISKNGKSTVANIGFPFGKS